MAVNVLIRESVGAALRFVRENLQFVATFAAIGAGVATLLALFAMSVPVLGLITAVASSIMRAFIYAALIGAVLTGAASVRGRIGADGWRVWGAMVVIGFFLVIVFVVLMLPGAFALAAGPIRPYVEDLQAAGSDQAAVMDVMSRFAAENPGTVAAFTLFYCIVWLLLTSRLYLAAPASADQGRILTFETWSWTKGATLRITFARILLLLPAYVLVSALHFIVARLLGIDPLNPVAAAAAAQGNPAMFLAYVFATTFITIAAYGSLEAGLSTYLYKGLKQTPQPAA